MTKELWKITLRDHKAKYVVTDKRDHQQAVLLAREAVFPDQKSFTEMKPEFAVDKVEHLGQVVI